MMQGTSQKRVFVTVGTTKFEKLIDKVAEDEILNVLATLGYNFVQFQIGNGNNQKRNHARVQLKYSTYFEDFSEQIAKADLVISHAGAGSCLEVLRQHKPFIVVINEELMDNHQIELAEQLQNQGYLQYCTVETLKDVLEANKFSTFALYPKADPTLFTAYLDRCVGF